MSFAVSAGYDIVWGLVLQSVIMCFIFWLYLLLYFLEYQCKYASVSAVS